MKKRYLQSIWFNTYNAAITGCLANGYDATATIRRAREVADKTVVFVSESMEKQERQEAKSHAEDIELVF